MDIVDASYLVKIRSKAGKEIDKAFERGEINQKHYHRIYNKSKYWEWILI